MTTKTDLYLVAGAGVALVAAAWIMTRGVKAAADTVQGIATGENDLTATATNAAGESVPAYYGAGVVGTVGAAANAASGGYLASAGEWIGGIAADVSDWFSGVNDRARANPGQHGPAVERPAIEWSAESAGLSFNEGVFLDPLRGW